MYQTPVLFRNILFLCTVQSKPKQLRLPSKQGFKLWKQYHMICSYLEKHLVFIFLSEKQWNSVKAQSLFFMWLQLLHLMSVDDFERHRVLQMTTYAVQVLNTIMSLNSACTNIVACTWKPFSSAQHMSPLPAKYVIFCKMC